MKFLTILRKKLKKNKVQDLLVILQLIKLFNPILYELLLSNMINAALSFQKYDLTKKIKFNNNIFFLNSLNIFSAKSLKKELESIIIKKKTQENLIYSINKKLPSTKNLKLELLKSFSFSLKKEKSFSYHITFAYFFKLSNFFLL